MQRINVSILLVANSIVFILKKIEVNIDFNFYGLKDNKSNDYYYFYRCNKIS